MKRSIFSYCFLVVIFLINGCQKEIDAPRSSAEGSLRVDASGNCDPLLVNGVYLKDSALKTTNFIEVQVNITEPGAYNIMSNTINGYSFSAMGNIDSVGLATIRLAGSGLPLAAGINSFTIVFPTSFGSTSCTVDVEVVSSLIDADYTLGTIGSACSNASVSGAYTVGVPVTQANTVLLNVNVTSSGSYSITTPLVNGISFSRSGTFTATGPQVVSLIATGTPITAAQSTFPVTGNSNSCSFQVTIVAVQSVAIFTLATTGTACASPVVAGTYTVGTALTALNTVSLNVNVTNVGAYTISAAPVMNGITFSGSGVFTVTGPQVVKLTGTGIPISAGPVSHTVTVGNTTCTFSVTYVSGTPPPTGPALFTYVGHPGVCTNAVVAGSYIVGTPLNASNTLTLQVNVTTPGTYAIASQAQFFNNGIQFLKMGTFTTTGIQNVVLPGTGNPTNVGIYQYSPTSPQGSVCTFTIKANTAPPIDFLAATFVNERKSFNVQARATYPIPSSKMLINGLTATGSPESLSLEIDGSAGGGAITAMFYNNNPASGFRLSVTYVDAAGAIWKPSDGSVNGIDIIQINIFSISATRVEGTFTTNLRSNGGNGTTSRSVRDASFSVAIQ